MHSAREQRHLTTEKDVKKPGKFEIEVEETTFHLGDYKKYLESIKESAAKYLKPIKKHPITEIKRFQIVKIQLFGTSLFFDNYSSI